MAEIEGYKATLISELCAYYEWGLSILIEEKSIGQECLHEICQVLEQSNYMRDYRTGKNGAITAVNFTKVEE